MHLQFKEWRVKMPPSIQSRHYVLSLEAGVFSGGFVKRPAPSIGGRTKAAVFQHGLISIIAMFEGKLLQCARMPVAGGWSPSLGKHCNRITRRVWRESGARAHQQQQQQKAGAAPPPSATADALASAQDLRSVCILDCHLCAASAEPRLSDVSLWVLRLIASKEKGILMVEAEPPAAACAQPGDCSAVGNVRNKTVSPKVHNISFPWTTRP